MRKIFIFIAMLTLSSYAFSQDVYHTDSIRDFNLNFYDSSWRDSLDNFYTNDLDDMMLANLTINGLAFDSVGVRWKGNSSCTSGQMKNPLHIELDYIKNQDYYGVETFKFSNLFKEPSFAREVAMYGFISWYMPSAKTNYANVYVEGTLLGFYTSSSSVNKEFMRDNFGSDENSRFKCDPVTFGGPPTPITGCPPPHPDMVSGLGFMGPDSACYVNNYEMKSDYGWTDLYNLIYTLEAETYNIENHLNVDRTLWMLAINNIFANLDSYSGSGHNYYVYKDDSSRFQPVIWDLNETFGTFQQGLTTNELIELDPYYNSTNNFRPLISKLLTVSDYQKKYFAHYRTIVQELLETDTIINRVVQLQTMIDSYVQADPNKLTTYTDFQNSLNSNIGLAIGIETFLTSRYNHIITDANYIKIPPTISTVTQVTQNPTYVDNVDITADVSNATSCKLGYRSNRFDPFIIIDMFDDGNHNDGANGDGVYGASIPAFSTTTQVDYYVYADNTDAGIFSPVRAQYEFYNYTIIGDIISEGTIVINEFMASNASTQSDQNGGFDDWIELYNTSSSNINLSGVYLSDKTDNIFKWKFPEIEILANDYLIIWADAATTETGLHTNFKLSSSGESVVLSNYDSTIIDMVNFGAQYTDTSYGRFPNATGSFQFLKPTYNAFNEELSVESINYADYVKVYPNPANNLLNLEYENIIKESKEEIFIYNLIGKQVASTRVDRFTNKITINTSSLENGIYILKFGTFAEKIIINR